MLVTHSSQLRDIDPFLTPSWRHQYASSLADASPPQRSPAAAGPEIRDYRAFLLSRKNNVKVAQWLTRNPYLCYAVQLYERREEDYEIPFMLECRILSGESYDKIAKKLKTSPEVVTWYSSLFFDVQPYLDSSDWIFHQVLLPAADKSQAARLMRQASANIAATEAGARSSLVPDIISPFYDPSIKFFSYLGGPKVCDLMLTGITGTRKPTGINQLGKFMEKQYRLTLQSRSLQVARSLPLNRYTALDFMKIAALVQDISKAGPNAVAPKATSQLQSMIGDMVSLASLAVGDTGIPMDSRNIVDRTDRSRVELDSTELVNASTISIDVLNEIEQFDSVFARRSVEANKNDE